MKNNRSIEDIRIARSLVKEIKVDLHTLLVRQHFYMFRALPQKDPEDNLRAGDRGVIMKKDKSFTWFFLFDDDINEYRRLIKVSTKQTEIPVVLIKDPGTFSMSYTSEHV